MNAPKTLIATIALAFAGIASAQEATPDTWLNVQSTKTREQVRAELDQARKDGTIGASGTSYNFVARAKSTKSREQVKAELAQAQASGEYQLMHNEVANFADKQVARDPAVAGAAATRTAN